MKGADAMVKKALGGLRVIEYAQNIGVPYAGKMMADLGAEVIKVEIPGRGDNARHRAPFVGGAEDSEKSCIFLNANSNKKSVTLDIDKPEGAAILKRLAAAADVFLREGSPEYFRERGLSYEELSAENPRLILASNTPFGESGPYKDYASSPCVLAHMGAGTALYPHGTGDDDKAPCMLGGNFEEYDPGPMVFIGVMGALHWRVRSGRGQYIENSALEAHLTDMATDTVAYPVYGQTFNRSGMTQRLQSSLCFPVKDGYMCPFLAQDKDFVALARMIGREEWLEEDWYKNLAQRRARCDEIADAIKEWGKNYTKAEATEIAQGHRLAIGPVETPADIVNSRHFSERGFFTTINHPVCGEMKYPGRPFIMAKTPHAYDKAAPLLGADNERVYGELLDISTTEQERLRAAGVI